MNPSDPLTVFRANVDSVSKLINFDKEVQDLAISGVEELHQFLKDKKGYDNPKWNGENTLLMLRGIRQSPVLRDRYSQIFNQAVVLLVSYFGSTLGDIFRSSSATALREDDQKILRTELKVSVDDVLQLSENPEQKIGDFLISHEKLSFQDMGSTHRAFREYFGVNIEVDERVHNIIAGQACRHAIVHDAARCNSRTMNQLRSATPRSLKPDLEVGQTITFTIAEVEALSADMTGYVEALAGTLHGD